MNRVGEALTAHYFIPQGFRLIGIQWLANRQEIVGATTRSFLAPQSLDGKRVSFDLIVSDSTGRTIFPRSMELAPGQMGTATSDLPTLPQPARPMQPQNDLSQDPSITKDPALTNIEVCKTADLSPRAGASNGFPRPANAVTGSVSPRILYVPIVFSDLPFTDSDLGRLKTATEKVTQFYGSTSYGKVNISYEFLPKQHWVMMKKSAADYRMPENIPQRSLLEVVEDAFALAHPSVNFGLYDGIVLSTGYSASIYAGVAYTGMTFKTNNGIAKAVSFEVGSSTGNSGTMAHELGHSLFGLEDLYVFLNPNRPSVPDPNPAGPWDIMSYNTMEFFGWNKLLMGWLEPSHVRCITSQSSSSHYIETIDSRGSNPKVVLVNLSNGITLAVEGRALPSRGVLVYKIDTRIQHGDGPILSEKLLLAPGAALTRDGWTIKVVGFDSKGFLIEVNRG